MDILSMTKQDFDNVERVKCLHSINCASIIIIPLNEIHESGFAMMDFVAVDDERHPICRWSTGADVLSIDGSGGYGKLPLGPFLPITRPIQAWCIDCIPCGYLRLFCNSYIKIAGGYSSFNIYYKPQKPPED